MERPSQANKFMLFLMIYMILMPAALQILVMYALPFSPDFDVYKKYIVLFGHILIFGIPIGFLCLVKNLRLGDLLPHEPLTPLSIVLVVFISLFTMPLMGAAGAVTQLFADDSAYKAADDFVSQFSLAYMISAVAFMPAVFEEITFRGVIMTGYKRSGIIRSIFFSALYFGIMHLTLYQLIYATVAGFVFGIMVHYSNSIFSSVLAHFIINGTQVVAGYYADKFTMPGPEQEYTTYEIIGSALLICLMSLPVLIGLLYAFVQINKGKETDYKYSLTDKHEFTADITADKDRDRAVDICFFLVLILYVGYTILEEVIMK